MVDDKRFRIHIMKRNINRIHGIALAFYETGRFISSCFSWDSKVSYCDVCDSLSNYIRHIRESASCVLLLSVAFLRV